MDYTAAEFRDFVCEEIDATVASWREQARMEEKRGAASQALIGTLLWGAERFETLKAQILSLPTEFVSVPS